MSDQPSTPDGNSYDLVPYRDFPYPFTHPRHLESLAALFGIEPAPLHRIRVLELGCAGGGNLIPQAMDLPESVFLGIDRSERQIAEGRRTIEALGLKNIELVCADIREIDERCGKFDYIISHGVYSWLPPPVQDKLLEISARNLAPQGVAFVSYNTYPGWHQCNIVRDLMRYHAAQFADPEKKIEQAKAMLEFLVEVSDPAQASGKLLKEELEALRRFNDDAYIFHEHLESDNTPVYFHQFIERAQAKGLQYLAEAEFHSMLLRNLPEKAHGPFSRLPIIRQEQYMDFVRGRRFRKTLLCHAAVPLQRQITPEKMKRFHFALTAPLEAGPVNIRNDDATVFRSSCGTINCTGRLIKAAMIHLKEICPGFIHFDQLYRTARRRIEAARPVAPGEANTGPDALANALLAAYSVNLVEIRLHPAHWSAQAQERPVASRLARLQAGRGDRVTNQRHETVPLDLIGRRLIHRLDGRHDRADLVADLQQAIAAGEIRAESAGHVVERPEPAALLQAVDSLLVNLSQSALLVE